MRIFIFITNSLGMMFHVSSWLRWSGIPRIMTTIHTAVDSKYTKDGKEGIPRGVNVLPLHQLNQDCRQVTQEDINGMKFSNYKSDYGNGTMVGDKSNILFDKNGKPNN